MCNRWVDRSWRRWRRCHENDTGRWRHRQSLVDNPHWERIPKNPQESPRIPEMLNQIKETQSDENIRFTKDNICLRFLLFHFHLEAKKRPRGQQQKARQIYLYKYIWERFKKEKNLMKAMRKRRERKRRRRRRRRRRKMLMLMETEKKWAMRQKAFRLPAAFSRWNHIYRFFSLNKNRLNVSSQFKQFLIKQLKLDIEFSKEIT